MSVSTHGQAAMPPLPAQIASDFPWADWLGPRPQPEVIISAKGPIVLPCRDVRLVPIERVRANNYNPNHVSPQNMDLLEESVRSNGFLYAVSVVYDDVDDILNIVDGFHRWLLWHDRLQSPVVPVTFPLIRDETGSYRPLGIAECMEATVQTNRARGIHQTELMSDLVRRLVQQGVEDEVIAKKLGMPDEEVYRLKQITGIAELFKHQLYSRAWEMIESDVTEEEAGA